MHSSELNSTYNRTPKLREQKTDDENMKKIINRVVNTQDRRHSSMDPADLI